MTWQAKRTTHYINGRFTDDEPTLGVENPATGAELARVADAEPSHRAAVPGLEHLPDRLHGQRQRDRGGRARRGERDRGGPRGNQRRARGGGADRGVVRGLRHDRRRLAAGVRPG